MSPTRLPMMNMESVVWLLLKLRETDLRIVCNERMTRPRALDLYKGLLEVPARDGNRADFRSCYSDSALALSRLIRP